ncbi:MAG: hypothetical protein ACHREM_00025 [Polyangiales bacterium]
MTFFIGIFLLAYTGMAAYIINETLKIGPELIWPRVPPWLRHVLVVAEGAVWPVPVTLAHVERYRKRRQLDRMLVLVKETDADVQTELHPQAKLLGINPDVGRRVDIVRDKARVTIAQAQWQHPRTIRYATEYLGLYLSLTSYYAHIIKVKITEQEIEHDSELLKNANR